ncbi:MAG: hypothetical protein IPK33_10370 [Gemmatimonadetes bacterium]|nr:hypothetical protein [Gemmatimonadota bacterium]
MPERRRVNVRAILADKDLRRALMVPTIQAIQAREGIETTREQAERAYYVVTETERAAFFELERFKGGKKGEQDKRHEMFVKSLRGEQKGVRHDIARRDFSAIDGSPLAFERVGIVAPIFRESPALDPSLATAVVGLQTSNDERFVRCWWEVLADNRGQGKAWVPFAKGGEFSRFYADIHLIVDWQNNGEGIRNFEGAYIRNEQHYFKPGLTWPRRTQRGFNLRVLPAGCVFADKGPAIFPSDESKTFYILGIANSAPAEFILQGLMSFGSWEVGVIRRLPVAQASTKQAERVATLAKAIHDAKRDWDSGNEISTSFERPWVVRRADTKSLSYALDGVLEAEARAENQIQSTYNDLNAEAYSLYAIPDATRAQIEKSLGERPPEVVWPQMEGQTTEQKRMEHVWRLLSFAVKRVLDADDDGIVPFNRSTGETPLAERVRHELAALFPECDESQLEVEIVNELKRSVKGYRKCASLDDWLVNAYFAYHAALYKSRPIYWHVASAQGTSPCAFGALVHYHRFDKNRMAKLRASYVRDTIEELRRDAGLADKAGRSDDRVELQAKLEEVQALDKKLQLIQEGHHEGAEGGDRDFRILTPWKEPAKRPNGWAPDLDDGVKVNIAPLDRAGLLRASGVAG